MVSMNQTWDGERLQPALSLPLQAFITAIPKWEVPGFMKETLISRRFSYPAQLRANAVGRKKEGEGTKHSAVSPLF